MPMIGADDFFALQLAFNTEITRQLNFCQTMFKLRYSSDFDK